MVWLLRAVVVCVFALDGPIMLAPNRQSLAANVVNGILAGLVAVWLASLVGNRCVILRARFPLGAKRVGVAFYMLGTAIAALCIGLAGFFVRRLAKPP